MQTGHIFPTEVAIEGVPLILLGAGASFQLKEQMRVCAIAPVFLRLCSAFLTELTTVAIVLNEACRNCLRLLLFYAYLLLCSQ